MYRGDGVGVGKSLQLMVSYQEASEPRNGEGLCRTTYINKNPRLLHWLINLKLPLTKKSTVSFIGIVDLRNWIFRP